MSILLCLAALAICYFAGRRSLVTGLVAVFSVGYGYGIARANIPETSAHFIFDAGLLGLYGAQLFRRLTPAQRSRVAPVRSWLELLVAWPLILFLIPIQDPLIQVVGLRGNIFFLPFLLIGARMEGDERYKLALWFAVLNILAFAVAGAEFTFGLESFFPQNQMTQLIYRSKDLAGFTAYRIPSTFANAHSYGGTMVATLPIILGAFIHKHKKNRDKILLAAGLGVAVLGVLLSGARIPFLIAAVLIVITTFSIRSRFAYALGWVLLLCCIGWMASGEARLQRFMELKDPEIVTQRLSWSLNLNFMEAAATYPFGNGLGGGGTSIPYFLQDRIRNPVLIENEYARIMLEQGLLGLMIWLLFIFWAFTRVGRNEANQWSLGRRLAWVVGISTFGYSVVGTGLLTSVPHSCLILLLTGWVAAPQPIEASEARPVFDGFRNDTSQPQPQFVGFDNAADMPRFGIGHYRKRY